MLLLPLMASLTDFTMCTQLFNNTALILICSIKYIVHKQDTVSLGVFQEGNYQEKYQSELIVHCWSLILGILS